MDSPRGIEIDVQEAQKSDPILVPDRPWEEGDIASVKGVSRATTGTRCTTRQSEAASAWR